MWRVWGRGEVCAGFWWGNRRERDHWGDPDLDGRIVLRWIFMFVPCINSIKALFILPQ
jgi:hypothetical protein